VVTLVGWLMVAWCVGFAGVNIGFVITDRFAGGPYADYATGITVMNWLVVALKILGAALALLSVARGPRFVPPAIVGVGLWGICATLAVYTLGSVAQAVAMISGLAGSPSQINLAGISYVLFFLLAAAGYGVLAISYSRRHSLGWGHAVLGLLGAPVVIGLVLLAMPAVLAAVGLMPAP